MPGGKRHVRLPSVFSWPTRVKESIRLNIDFVRAENGQTDDAAGGSGDAIEVEAAVDMGAGDGGILDFTVCSDFELRVFELAGIVVVDGAKGQGHVGAGQHDPGDGAAGFVVNDEGGRCGLGVGGLGVRFRFFAGRIEKDAKQQQT